VTGSFLVWAALIGTSWSAQQSEAMGVSDAPKFQVIMHGRLHVRTNESSHQIVTNSEDEPVKNVAHLGKISSTPRGKNPI
jgi:hypothetical protein